MKKRFLTALFLLVLMAVFLPGRANAAGDVELNAANFPDPAFRAVAKSYDKDGDGSLSTVEIANVKYLHCCDMGISSLTGVEKFTALESLSCYNNQLTSLDVSGLPRLTQLNCWNNQLTSLDISGLTMLTKLYCHKNQLKSLDVSRLTNLEYLWCSNNQLTSLDVSRLTMLTQLQCDTNQLTSLDVSCLTNLTRLYCGFNQLTSLDVSRLTNLEYLGCSTNQLTSLDVSRLTNLKQLGCHSNRLTSLDVSRLTNLVSLDCFTNQLTSLDVSNNTNLKQLTCFGNNLTTLDITKTKAAFTDNAKFDSSGVGSQSNNQIITVLMTESQKKDFDTYCADGAPSNWNQRVNAVTSLSTSGPRFTAEPVDISVITGSTATFKVVASGSGLTYQWQWRAGTTGTWANCSSATSGYNTATLKPVGTAARNGYQYRCVVKDSSGKSVTSNTATLKVLAITAQPVSQSVELNTSASFKVTALNAASYQWQWRTGSTGTWANCSSATSGYNTATLKPVGTSARNGYQYRCIVKDASGNTVTSNTATLTVKAGLAITTQPASVTVTEGSTATFKIVASGASSYQWQWRAGASGTWANCSSATSGYNTATLKPVGTSARNGYQYRCIVKDASGKSVTSNTATLTVKAGLAITTQPASVSVTTGSTATFKVVATGASSYQWQWRAGASGTWANCSSATSGYNTATLKPVGTAARNGYQYRCVVKDANGNSVTSNTATLTVKAASGVSITTQPASVSVTTGSTATFKVVASGASSYQWQWRASSTGTWANCSSATSGYNTATLKPVGTAARNGYQYRCIVKDASGNSVTSNVATLTVK